MCSSVPAGLSLSSEWVKITCGSETISTPSVRRASTVAGDVVDLEIDQRAGRILLQQQPDRTGAEEQQPGWVEEAGRLLAQQLGVERAGPVQVLGVLGDLQNLGHGPVSPPSPHRRESIERSMCTPPATGWGS